MDPNQVNQNPTPAGDVGMGTPVVDPNAGVQVPPVEPTMPTPPPAMPVEPVAPVAPTVEEQPAAPEIWVEDKCLRRCLRQPYKIEFRNE